MTDSYDFFHTLFLLNVWDTNIRDRLRVEADFDVFSDTNVRHSPHSRDCVSIDSLLGLVFIMVLLTLRGRLVKDFAKLIYSMLLRSYFMLG